MSVGPELSKKHTFSDNFTILDMQGATILSPEVFDRLVEVTQSSGICDRDLADARQIQANLANIGDPRAQAFYGLIERMLEQVEAGATAQMGHQDPNARRANQLPSMAWREDSVLTPEKEIQLERKSMQLQERLAKCPALGSVKGRIFHRKPLFAQMCRLVINNDLPEYVKRGSFSDPGEYKAVIRFSSGQGTPYSDLAPDVRGVAIKWFTIRDQETDILMTSAPAFIARDVDQFLKLAEVMIEQQVDHLGMTSLVNAGFEFVQKALVAQKIHEYEADRIARSITGRAIIGSPPSLAFLQYWGTVVRLGNYAVKPTLVPETSTGADILSDVQDPDCLGKDMDLRIQQGNITYKLRLLFFVSEKLTPINDATKSWDDTPVQVDVGRIVIASQKSEDKATARDINKMAFTPGNGFQALSIARARDPIYRASAVGRGAWKREEYRRLFI